jgi:hypothetical protein
MSEGRKRHAVHNDGVPIAGKPQQFSQLRPGEIPAGGLVREDPVQDLAV